MGKRTGLLMLLCTIWLPAAAEPCLGDRSAPQTYSVQLVPRIESTRMYRHWAPFLQRLGLETGNCFQLQVATGFPAFESDLLNGRADFSYMNPYHQVMVKTQPGYVPLFRQGASELAGVLVVRKEATQKNLQELQGEIAFPSPNAYVASLLMRAHLDQQTVPFTPVYLGSHSSVYRAVAFGQYQAGGGATTTLSSEPLALQQALRVIYTTPSYMPHPFSAHPRVPAATRDAITTAVLRMTNDDQGRQLLNAIQIPQPVAADYNRDYLPLEQLHLERYVEPSQ